VSNCAWWRDFFDEQSFKFLWSSIFVIFLRPLLLVSYPRTHCQTKCCEDFLFFSFFFFSTGAWIEYYWVGLHFESPHQLSFMMGFFQGSVSWTICLGWVQTVILLISASWVARITGVSHKCLAGLFLRLSTMVLKFWLGFWYLCREVGTWSYILCCLYDTILFSFALLGIELRASSLLGKPSTTWTTPPALAFLILWYCIFHILYGIIEKFILNTS
jgi:hypothetical protein